MRRRGFTQVALGRELGVSKQYISQLETAVLSPTREMVERIARVLEFPIVFFFGERVEPLAANAPSFRAQRKMTSTIRNAGLGGADVAAAIIAADFEKRFTLPQIDIPDLGTLSSKPEEAADILRARWNLGYEPITNVVHLLESKGVKVFWLNIDAPSLDAISFWYDSKPFVILNQHKDAGDRGRFDASHELGHLVLHQHDTSNLDNKAVESEAHRFASAFLLPRATFELECPETPDFNKLYQLKVRWRVAIQAMIYRGHELGIFSDWQKQQAFQKMQVSGEKKREKVFIQREESKLHEMIFERLTSTGMSMGQYADELGLKLTDLQELTPMIRKFLSHESAKIISLEQERQRRKVISSSYR